MDVNGIPRALHRGEDDLPFVSLGDGTHVQLLQADEEEGLWVVRTQFEEPFEMGQQPGQPSSPRGPNP